MEKQFENLNSLIRAMEFKLQRQEAAADATRANLEGARAYLKASQEAWAKAHKPS